MSSTSADANPDPSDDESKAPTEGWPHVPWTTAREALAVTAFVGGVFALGMSFLFPIREYEWTEMVSSNSMLVATGLACTALTLLGTVIYLQRGIRQAGIVCVVCCLIALARLARLAYVYTVTPEIISVW